MLTKHDERKMPKNRGHIASLARSYTDTAIKTLAGIMMEPNCPPMARVAAAKVLLDRGWGEPKEMHHSGAPSISGENFSQRGPAAAARFHMPLPLPPRSIELRRRGAEVARSVTHSVTPRPRASAQQIRRLPCGYAIFGTGTSAYGGPKNSN